MIIVTFLLSKVLPGNNAIMTWLLRSISVSFYAIFSAILGTIAGTILVVWFFFNKKYAALKQDALTDELTGLKNHKAFQQHLVKIIDECSKSDNTFSVIMLDVDDFKRFNREFSPNIADGILGKIGELLKNDKRITDETFRQFLRGDEFVVVAKDTSLNDAYRAAERKRSLIDKTAFILDGKAYRLTVSCGVTEYKKGKDGVETITDRVNSALVEAKSKSGKNNTQTSI